jgi:hypothetical protein
VFEFLRGFVHGQNFLCVSFRSSLELSYIYMDSFCANLAPIQFFRLFVSHLSFISIRRLDMLGLRTRSAVQHEPSANGDERYPKRAKSNAQSQAQAKAPSAQAVKKRSASKLYAIAKI